jgi:hypothetical protein
MKNLSGWTRLWVLISGIWVLLTTAFIPKFLSDADYLSAAELRSHVSDEIKSIMVEESTPNAIRVRVTEKGEIVFLKSGMPHETVRKMQTEFRKAIKDVYWEKIREGIFYLVVIASSFPIILYLFSRSVYWVWTGFTKPRNQMQ